MGIIVGCDVSRDWIDVQMQDRQARIANDPTALAAWARQLPSGCRVGMEATGTLHEELALKLFERDHIVYVLNPRWVHQYAKAVGLRGKTDRGDAGVIARFVAAEWSHLKPYEPPSALQRELRTLLLRRVELVKLKTATRQSLGAEATELLEAFKKVLDRINHRIAQLIAGVAEWQDLASRLRTEPGVGPVVSAHLVQVLTRFPFATADAFIAHTGLDPRPNDSGQKQGRRRLTHHGDATLRTMLFMAAVAACKVPAWRALYEAYRKKGLPSTAAYVIVARKLARIAFSLFKSGQNYDPRLAPNAITS
jgi:transposase